MFLQVKVAEEAGGRGERDEIAGRRDEQATAVGCPAR
jgi:hypothetical protein